MKVKTSKTVLILRGVSPYTSATNNELLPGCNMKDPLLHVHPHAIETYEILNGEMEFFIKNKWVIAKKGDKLTVPKGITHAFRNPSDKIVTVFNTHQPALQFAIKILGFIGKLLRLGY